MQIAIIGGGTGGWLCAARIKQKLPLVDVTLIESPNVPSLGVGESVVPPLRLFLQELGLNDTDWMGETGSIYKLGNRFENWAHNKGEQHYFTFSYNLAEDYILKDQTELDISPWLTYNHSDARLSDYWLALRHAKNKTHVDFNKEFDCQYHFMEKNKSPFNNEDYLLNPLWSSSFHVNADKLWRVVKEVATKNGVKHISTHITDIIENDAGIERLITDTGVEIDADYFLDCSGLSRLLIKKVSDSWRRNEFITTNRCWVMPVKYSNPREEMHNYTRSTAMNAGWKFKVTLYHRYGTGYCFDSNFTSDQDALDEILQHVDEKNLIRDPRMLKWDPGYYTKPWTKNVVAVGLSAGFAEPMEANGLYLTISNIDEVWKQLSMIYNNSYGQEEASRRYNQKSNILFDDTYEFIYAHYHLTQRADTDFWKYQKEMGLKNNTVDMVKSHYRSPINTTQMCADGYTIYPDYVWASMAEYYGVDTKSWDLRTNKDLLDLANAQFSKLNHHWASVAEKQIHFYDWIKDHRFNGKEHYEVQEELDV